MKPDLPQRLPQSLLSGRKSLACENLCELFSFAAIAKSPDLQNTAPLKLARKCGWEEGFELSFLHFSLHLHNHAIFYRVGSPSIGHTGGLGEGAIPIAGIDFGHIPNVANGNVRIRHGQQGIRRPGLSRGRNGPILWLN